MYVRARAVIPGYRTAAAECPACRGAHATPRSSRSHLLSRKHATPQAISRNATRNIRHPTGNTAAIRMPSPSPSAQIPRNQLPPPHRRTVYPSPAPVYEGADAACMARGNVEDAVPYRRAAKTTRRPLRGAARFPSMCGTDGGGLYSPLLQAGTALSTLIREQRCTRYRRWSELRTRPCSQRPRSWCLYLQQSCWTGRNSQTYRP